MGKRGGRRRARLAAVAVAAGAVVALGASAADAATFEAHGSVEQVYVTGASPGARITLLRPGGGTLASRSVDSLGAALFRDVKPGAGYRVRVGSETSPRLTVLTRRTAPPSTRVYDQTLPAGGYGYLRTRDGTQLAIDVHLPGPADKGPYPTFVEYSGYGYADPAGPHSSIQPIASLLGYAVVDVNMRGTGCSGGAFDYFEWLQSLDGYDVIETVARQPWVMHHRVGMMGVSYGGISQLFVGQTNPPHLAAIAPLSVIDNTATTLYPGGILNTGFALSWAQERVHDAMPASATGGQEWAYQRIQAGDRICKANQALHAEAVDLIAKIRANRYYVPKVADPVSPITFVHRIRRPVFLACQWTDEQTGGHCPALADHFTGTKRKWFTFTNGVHTDSLDPATFNRWFDFLELYVAQRAPKLPPGIPALAPTIYGAVLGIPNVKLPPDPIQSQPTYAAAKRAFDRQPRVRVLFDNGAGGSSPGQPYAAFEEGFSRWPVPGTRARTWYLSSGGRLSGHRPRRAHADAFTWNAGARPPTDFSGNTGAGGLWGATPDYHWAQNPAGTALSYVTAPLARNTTVIGAGYVTAWIRSSARAPYLQATVTEVRPDGKETFVQSGWLRTEARRLDPRFTERLAPFPDLRRSAVSPLPRGRWAKVTIPLYYEGHAYRRGSRIRVLISAPGGDQPVWSFGELSPNGTASVWLAHSRRMASRLVLPVVPRVGVPTGLPPCPGLRGEPCRAYQPLANRAAPVRLTG